MKSEEVTSIQPAPGAEAMNEITELTKKLCDLGQTDLVGRANGWEFRMKKIGLKEKNHDQPEKRKLKFEEINPLIIGLSSKVFKLIEGELTGIHDNQRWLIQGRVLNLCFAGFYGPTIDDTQRLMDEKEKELQQ